MQQKAIYAQLRDYPTGYREVDVEVECCAIHTWVNCGNASSPGCAGLPHGTHRSIQALHGDTKLVCHALVGARVLDRQLFLKAVRGEDLFLRSAFNRSYNFRKRYMSGAPIGWLSYGAGYCYLQPISETARSRVARCLGPLPLVADVVRFLLLLGDSSILDYSLEPISATSWHLSRGGSMTLGDLITSFMVILAGDPWARVGGSEDETPSASSEVIGSMCRVTCLTSMAACVDRVDVIFPRSGLMADAYQTSRREGLRGWLQAAGLVLDDHLIDQLLVVTCAPIAVGGGGTPAVRDHVRMLAVLGDSVLKTAMSAHVIAIAGAPAVYAELSKRFENQALATTLLTSGLRTHCAAYGLSAISKANADMLEAFIGVLAGCIPASTMGDFLRYMKLLPDKPDTPLERFPMGGMVRGLNSRQYARALRMAADGVL